MKLKNMIYELFIPRKKEKVFNFEKYTQDLDNGVFRDKFCLGVSEENNGKWHLKNFQNEPNAIFVGSMGSGKSQAGKFSLLTWLLANNDKTLCFIVDPLKAAQDYKVLFPFENVYTILSSSDGIHKLMELLYDESKERSKLFSENESESLSEYEHRTQQALARIIVMFEEFHAVPNIINFDKEYKTEGTSANKFFTLMKIGRAQGIWFMACSQKATKSDVPSEIVTGFTQKQIFKVSQAESSYWLGHPQASRLQTKFKGRCYVEGIMPTQVQFPWLGDDLDSTTEKLIEKYVKPYNATCAYLNQQMIKDFLSGRTTEDLYKHKKLSELAQNIDKANIDAKVVISMMHKASPHKKIEVLEDNLDEFGLTHILTALNGQRIAITIKKGIKKIMPKHLQDFSQGIKANGCDKGIMYVAIPDTPPESAYKLARNNLIELVDMEDLIRMATKIDHANETGNEFEIDPEHIADDDKESGSFFKLKGSEKDLNFGEDYVDPEDAEVLNLIEGELNLDDEFEKSQPLIEKMPEIEPIKDPKKIIDDIISSNPRVTQNTVIKRPNVNINFKLSQDDNPTLMVNFLKNKNGDFYRILFLTIVDDSIAHRFFIDKQVSGLFDYETKIKLGITSEDDWNSNPLVLSEEKFDKVLAQYMSNFDNLSNMIYIVCSRGDLELTKNVFSKFSKVQSNPTIIEDEISEVFGEQGDRLEIIKKHNVKVEKQDIWEEINLDYELWNIIF